MLESRLRPLLRRDIGWRSKEYELCQFLTYRKKGKIYMKNRKGNMLKKPVFYKKLIGHVLFGTIIAVCIAYVGTMMAAHFYGLNMESTLLNINDNLNEDLVENYKNDSEDMEQFFLGSILDMNSYSLGGLYAFALVDQNTKEIVVQSSDTTLFLLDDAENDQYDEEDVREFMIYGCDDKEIVDSIRTACEETGYAPGTIYLKMEDFYLQGYKFIPGKINVMTYGEQGNNVLKEMDFTPEDVSEYEHIIVGNKSDYSYGEPFLHDVCWSEDSAEYLNDFIFNHSDDWYIDEGGYSIFGSYKGIGKNEFFVAETLNLGEEGEPQYCVVGTCSYNFFQELKPELLTAYGILAFITLFITFITSYTSYLKQKNFYEMDQYRRDITNTMAHDLKSPLMVISGYAENLLEEELDDKPKRFTSSILENVQYMNQIIEKTLELSKVENADYKLHKEAVDLREVTNGLVQRYLSQLEKRGLEIQISGECTVNAEKMCMIEVIDNLISNATKYAIEGSVIEVCLEKRCYEISNVSAVDFDMDVQNLLKPFVKGDNSRSGKNGSGIGLTIAKNLCEQHGYKLNVECNDGIFVAKIIL